ncbi:epithelial sodium channel subunit gamma isoform X4 [Calonectris borealis]|uniref:epithelial sodium channel subunit gamma isoform X4 n=1 Tax=Calonectris borealis TaxID=1323832 RepID=UPI003F4C35AB
MAPPGPEGGRAAAGAMAPGKKITARIKRTLPVRGPQAPTLSELMRWYCLNTNTHGCRRIVVSRGRLRRFIWILLTLSAVGLILWQCAELLMNYYSASVSVTVQFQKLPFPAVTICNINPYKYSSMKDYLSELDKETKKALETFYGFSEGKSKVRRSVDEWNSTGSDFFKQIPLLKFEDFSKTVTDFRSGQKRKIEGSVFHKDSSIVNSGDSNDIIGFQLCDANNSSECALYTFSSGVNAIQEWYKLHYMNIMAQIPLETKEKLSYSADDLLLTCFFDGLSCDKRHFTRFHHPLHGNCYTFNSGENGTILSTSTGGSEYGLQVVLYIDEADYNPFLVTSTGAKIIVHDQNEYPFIEDIGTEIETAAATSIGMHFTRSRKLSKPYSDCTETGADIPVENLYNKSYSLQICLHSCFQKAMVDSCGCAQYAQPLPAGAEYCNYKKNPNWTSHTRVLLPSCSVLLLQTARKVREGAAGLPANLQRCLQLQGVGAHHQHRPVAIHRVRGLDASSSLLGQRAKNQQEAEQDGPCKRHGVLQRPEREIHFGESCQHTRHSSFQLRRPAGPLDELLSRLRH